MTSAQTDRRFMETREIPIRRIMITDPSQIPSHLSQTPNGTIYGTTPGGSRVVYDRSLLLKLSCSPLTKTPPNNMARIPGVTVGSASPPKNQNPVANCKTQAAAVHTSPVLAKGTDSDEQQFEMDI